MKKMMMLFMLYLPVSVMTAAADSMRATIQERVEGEVSDIGYATVAEASESLSGQDGITGRTSRNGWLEYEDKSRNVLWSFVSPEHPAYPSVIRRTTSGNGDALQIDMSAICEAEKTACEKLVREMLKMNAIARNRFVRNPLRGGGAKPDVTPIGSVMASGPR